MENTENTRQLAEHIAEILRKNEIDDSSLLRSSLKKINKRLDKIESRLNLNQPNSFIAQLPNNHPSVEKFDVAEAFPAEAESEKICTFEPNEKPCDYCSMCSSRGF